MAATTGFINALLNAAFRGTTYTGGTITIGLFRAGGVEVSGGGYSRQTITFSAASNKAVSSSSDVTFTNLPTGQTIVAYKVYDDSTVIDEANLATSFTADLTNNELTLSYKFELG